MIKVNLLEGAADTRAASRATKAVAKTTQQMLMVVGALLLLVVALAVDYSISSARLASAQEELAKEQAIAAQLKQDREKKVLLEKQIASVKNRIKIIEDLQKQQQGPSTMLNLINDKMPDRSNMVLDSIEQRGDTLTIKGTARTEEIVSQFARGLELGSQGLFQSLSVTTAQQTQAIAVGPDDVDQTPRSETVYSFVLSTKYTPTQVGAPADGAGAVDTTKKG